MLFCFNNFKPAFKLNKAAKIQRIEFKPGALLQVKKLMLINRFKAALNNAMLQKSVH